jgi:DtxR family Mn-dependent transcriptional regulator
MTLTHAQPLSESLEDYLEAIYHIVAAKQAARATDIGRRMKVKGSSVTGALKCLAERGLVNYAPYDIVTLTAEGTAAARKVAHRHEVLQDFFTSVLAVDDDLASAAACGMEHHVGRDVLERLGCLAQFIAERSHADGGKWLGEFLEYCSSRQSRRGGGRRTKRND